MASPADHCLKLLRTANGNEEARKLQLVSQLRKIFPEDHYQSFIDDLAQGAEKHLKTPPSSVSESKPDFGDSAFETGFADSAFGGVIIEFKSDLSKSNQHDTAKSELCRYTSAIWNEKGADSVFCCIATDVHRWEVWRPVPDVTESFEGKYSASQVVLDRQEEFDSGVEPDEEDAEHLLSLLKRLLFDNNLRDLSSQTLLSSFGPSSTIYSSTVPQLRNVVDKAAESGEVSLAIDLWRKHQRFNAPPGASFDVELYSSQLYLVLLSRLLVAAFHTKEQSIEINDETIESFLTGEFFLYQLGVRNFVEDDFFGWTKRSPWLDSILPVVRQLFHELRRFNFGSAQQANVLRLIYEEMMPAEYRDVLGQRSTPDRLAELVVSRLLPQGSSDKAFLDPACGTGTFLRAAIANMRSGSEEDTSQLESIVSNTAAIDIDPVATLIAKAVWVINTIDLLPSATEPTSIPVYHADSFFLPDSVEQGGSNSTESRIVFDDADQVSIPMPEALLEKGQVFDTFVRWCSRKARYIADSAGEGELSIPRKDDMPAVQEVFESELLDLSKDEKDSAQDAMRELVREFAVRMHEGRNGVWAFVVRNSYRPSLLAAQFDVMACNPPWLTISSMSEIDVPYSRRLRQKSQQIGIVPSGSSGHHLEIAVPFGLHAVDHYLDDDGDAALVMPRSIFDGDQHDAFRRLNFQDQIPFELTSVWDLGPVDGLFKIPSCVILGRTKSVVEEQKFPVRAEVFSSLSDSLNDLDERKLYFHEQSESSAWDYDAPLSIESQDDIEPQDVYGPEFAQGADLMPRTAVIVQIEGEGPIQTGDSVAIRTSEVEEHNYRNKVLKGEVFTGVVDERYLYKTVKSSNVLPFVTLGNSIQTAALPMRRDKGRVILSEEDMINLGDLDAVDWFNDIDEKLDSTNIRDRVDERGKLTKQSKLSGKYLVQSGASGSTPCASVYRHPQEGFPFVMDQTLYTYATQSKSEAYYLIGMLNSNVVENQIDRFQSRSGFGKRHIHKLPFRILPHFDSNERLHLLIAELSERLEKHAEKQLTEYELNLQKPLHVRRRKLSERLNRDLLSRLDDLVGAALQQS